MMYTYRQTLDWVCLLLYTMEVYVMSNRVHRTVTIDVDFVKYHMKANKIRMTNDLDKKLGVSSRTIKRWFDNGCIPYDMIDIFRESIGITMPQLCGYNLPKEYTVMKKEEELSKLNKYTLYFEITKLGEIHDNATEYMGMSFEDACTRYKDANRNDHRKIFESYEEALEYSAVKRLDGCFIYCKSRKDYIYVLEKAVEYIHSLLDMDYDFTTTMLKWEWSSGDVDGKKIMNKLNPKIRERIFTYNLAIDYLEMVTTCLGIS